MNVGQIWKTESSYATELCELNTLINQYWKLHPWREQILHKYKHLADHWCELEEQDITKIWILLFFLILNLLQLKVQ